MGGIIALDNNKGEEINEGLAIIIFSMLLLPLLLLLLRVRCVDGGSGRKVGDEGDEIKLDGGDDKGCSSGVDIHDVAAVVKGDAAAVLGDVKAS